ncbi:hypothetical protein INT45_012802 [Circinella minor]|uniref:Homeobox domain-containing protein n=1 Tax=Circinella minor TaxID=1195481 RepID=A0A8H7RSF7_9FUNG|nr:hypothetical protein INT45_012802 [Circinella minor]
MDDPKNDLSINPLTSTTVVRQRESEQVVKNEKSSQQTNETKDRTNEAIPLTQQQNDEQENYTATVNVDGQEYQEVEEEVTSDNNNGNKRRRYYYNEQTTYHLKKLFYETIGHGRKPTRQERHILHEQTGVNPRKMTYYLSNMKRRHIRELQEFRQLINEGAIDGRYASYVNYCNRRMIASASTSRQEEGKEEQGKNNKEKVDCEEENETS